MTQRENHHNPQAKCENQAAVDTGGGAHIGGDAIAETFVGVIK